MIAEHPLTYKIINIMKKIDFVLCALFFVLIIAAKPSDAYEKAMKSAIEQVFQAQRPRKDNVEAPR